MHSLVPLALITCFIQVSLCSVARNVFAEKWEKQVIETAQERVFTCTGVDGNHASPQQCVANYYQCLDGVAYPQTCPAGNVFDPVTSVCTPSSQASCNQNLDCSSDGLFPYPDACTNLYYVCSAGQSYVEYCPVNYAFDPVVLRCVAVENASCTPTTSTTTTSTSPSAGTTGTTPTTTATVTTTRTSTTTQTAPTTTERSTIQTTTPFLTSTTVETTPQTSFATTPSMPPTVQSTTSTTMPTPTSMSTTAPSNPTTRLTTPATAPTTTPASTSTLVPTTKKVTPTTTQSVTSPTMTVPTTRPTTIATSTPTTLLATARITTTKLTTAPVATPTTPAIAPPAEFACSFTGNYPYPGNCSIYYVCGGGVYIVAACPDTRIFNPSTEFCEDPINVPGCED